MAEVRTIVAPTEDKATHPRGYAQDVREFAEEVQRRYYEESVDVPDLAEAFGVESLQIREIIAAGEVGSKRGIAQMNRIVKSVGQDYDDCDDDDLPEEDRIVDPWEVVVGQVLLIADDFGVYERKVVEVVRHWYEPHFRLEHEGVRLFNADDFVGGRWPYFGVN